MKKVSIIIPVHNGEKYIKKTVSEILRQTYTNIEVVLVENFSNDDSLKICKEIETFDNRVKTIQSFEKGTSLARKKGVEYATGEYIIFSDQDDLYINKNAIKEMYKTICNEEVQIVQFGSYRKYKRGFIQKKSLVKDKLILNREELISTAVGSLFCDTQNILTVTVWDKIYKADLLKEVVKEVNDSLFYAEDMNLNIRAFLNKKTQKICIVPECYYVWNLGIGFSSTQDSGLALCMDYEKIKIDLIKLARSNKVPEDIIFKYNVESIYLFKVIIDNMISEKKGKSEIIEVIKRLDCLEYIKYAKEYFRETDTEMKVWDELFFLSTYKKSEDLYNYCVEHKQNTPLKRRIKNIILKLITS